MKSNIFRNAWKLYRAGFSFRDALRMEWAAFKADVEVIINTTWNGKTTVAYKKICTDGFVTAGSIEKAVEMARERKPLNMSGAKHDYGFGLNNGD